MVQQKIVEYLLDHPFSSKQEIKTGISFSGSDASFKRCLQKALSEGIIIRSGKGRASRYSMTVIPIVPSEVRKYPDGIQTFEKIVQERYLYIDKTDLIWKLANGSSSYIFLSRPRRFGKSLLISTLKAYFEGKKDLFKGLAIEDLESEWKERPVIRLDLSTAGDALNEQQLYLKLGNILSENEDFFGIAHVDSLPGERLNKLVKAVYEKTGEKVVLLIDEYDAPLLNVLYDDQKQSLYRTIVKELFSPIKKLDPILRFVFLSGITKFSQMSIFSTLNNLRDISLEDEYASLCGFTENEVITIFRQDIQTLADTIKEKPQTVITQLKQRYDGYHFSPSCQDIYNPYSVLRIFASMRMSDYWYSSGTPTILFDTLKRFDTDIYDIDGVEVTASVFNQPTEVVTNAVSLLYQSGYLTIKEYNSTYDTYILTIPNAEVRAGLMENLLPLLTSKNPIESQNLAIRFKRALVEKNIDKAMELLQGFFASIPYPEYGKKTLETLEQKEAYFQRLFYIVFSFMNIQIFTEVINSEGRTDAVLYLGDTVYIVETKLDASSAQEAVRQIDEKGYVIRYKGKEARIVKIGLNFSSKTRTIQDWVIVYEER